MPDDLVFVVHIYGQEALKESRELRTRVVTELTAAEQKFQQALEQTLGRISSQTRRLSYNSTRLGQVTELVERLGKTWLVTESLLKGGGVDAFDTLVQSAQQAYDEIAGHSILRQLYNRTNIYYELMQQQGSLVFGPLAESAEQAADVVEKSMKRAAQPRFPAGAQIGGVGIGGKFTTPEMLEQYHQGLLQIDQLFPGIHGALEDMGYIMRDTSTDVDKGAWSWSEFTAQLNRATLQYFGLRRLGYGLEAFGGQMAAAGERQVQTLLNWARMYGEFNEYATRAAAAMEMTREQQRFLETSVLENVEAMRLFSPEETIDGLRTWAAGTGVVIQEQEQLNDILNQTTDIQILAALGNDELAKSMLFVGAGIAEYGLKLDDVTRVVALYNFTAAKSFAEMEDVGNAFKLVGPLAHSYGISIEETAAAVALLSNENIKGTMAGRAFRQMLLQLSKPTKQHTDAMNEALGLTGELGDSWQDLVFPEGKFIGLSAYVDLLAAAMENLTQQQKNTLLATIATANEMPALTTLVNTQIEARKEGINVLRAWTKWSVGTVDEEVRAFARMMEENRGISIDVATDMYSLWDQQSTLFFDSEQAKLRQLEQRWRTMQLSLGRIVLVEGAPIIDALMDQLQKFVDFANAHPGLVTAAMTAAAMQLLVGNILRAMGQLFGVAANLLIMRGAFAGFSISTTAFGKAVQVFAQSVGVQAAGGGAGGAPASGLAKWLPLLVRGGLVLGLFNTAVDGTAKGMQRTREVFQAFNEEQQRYLFGITPEERKVSPFKFLEAEGTIVWRETGKPAGMSEIIEQLRDAEMLTDDTMQRLEELGLISVQPSVDVEVTGEETPEELQALLQELGLADVDVNVNVQLNFTEEQIQAVELYESMWEELARVTEEYTRTIERRRFDFWEREIKFREEFLKRASDLVDEYNKREERYLRDHERKKAKIWRDYEKQVARAEEDFQERLREIRSDQNKEILEEEEDLRERIRQEEEEHNKKLRRMAEDHRDRLFDLAVKRDAYGIYMEMREYKKRRAREQEDHADRIKRLKEEGSKRIEEIKKRAKEEEEELRKSHKRKLEDLKDSLEERLAAEDENYEEARRQRAEDHRERLRELREQYDEQRAERKEAFERELADLKEKFEEEYDEIRTSKTEELAMLLGMYDQGLEDYAAYLQARLDELEKYLERERDLWEAQPEPAPIGDGGNGGAPPFYPPGALTMPVGRLPAAQSAPVIVQGRFDASIAFEGTVPEGAEELVLEKLDAMFSGIVRQMEVEYV